MKYNRYPKRDAIKNYFPLPNEIFSLELCTGEISVYSYLLYREDRKTYQCHPSYKTIGRAIRASQNTVRKYVAALEDKGLIATQLAKLTTVGPCAPLCAALAQGEGKDPAQIVEAGIEPVSDSFRGTKEKAG